MTEHGRSPINAVFNNLTWPLPARITTERHFRHSRCSLWAYSIKMAARKTAGVSRQRVSSRRVNQRRAETWEMIVMAIIRRIRGHILLIGFLIAAVVASGTALLFARSESKTETEALVPLAARVDKIDGTVGIDRQFDSTQSSAQAGHQDNQIQESPDWTAPTRNAPVSVGDRIYVRDRSHLGVAFSGRNYARLNPNTELDVLSLAERRTQLALREGSAVFDVGALAPGELCEVATPYGAVDFVRPGLYQVGIDDSDALVSVLSGLAQVVGLGGSGQCTRGQLLTLRPPSSGEALVSQIDPNVCGSIVDDYYGYRYPDTYDGRYDNYDTYLSDPYYYDPYRRSASYQYCPDEEDIAGLSDLDSYGDWNNVQGYGYCWHPRVNAGWVPYQDGYWSNDYPLGLTWVSNESWGWAPYHYGRWACVNQDWYWVPSEAIASPFYAPALCAFVPLPQFQQIGWCPLGPGDPYVPRYYDAAFRPQYIGSSVVINRFVNTTRIVNYNVPGAVTIVAASGFAGVIRPNGVIRGDQRSISETRPVVDPFTVPTLRQAAINTTATRPRVQVPAAVAQRAFNKPVLTSDPPALPNAIANSRMANSLQAQPVPRSVIKQKLQINNTGQVAATRQPNGLPLRAAGPATGSRTAQSAPANQAAIDQQRQAQIKALSQRAAQGDRPARRELRQLQQQATDQQRMEAKTARRSANQQSAAQQQATRQQAADQAKAQRAQQQAVQSAQPGAQREQRLAARQQQQSQAQARQQQQQAQPQQAEQRRQARQQAAQQDQMRQQQMQQQRQAARQQQQDQMRQQQMQQQRQAARQQQQDQMRQQQMQQQRLAARQQQQDQMRQQQMQQQRQAARQQQQDQMRQQQMQQQRQAARQQQPAPQSGGGQSKADRKAARRQGQ